MKMKCVTCGSEFDAKRRSAKFCGKKCLNEYWNGQIREEKKSYKSLDELTKEDIERIIQARPDLKIKFE